MDKQPPPPPLQPVGARPMHFSCPHCRIELQFQPQHAGDIVTCPSCGGRFQTPMPQAYSPRSTASYERYGGRETGLNQGIKICTLVSGVANILAGLVWISTLCGAPIGIGQIVLAIFEILYFAQADKKPLDQAINQAKLLAVFEIISGVFNIVSLPCGILVLVFANQHE